MSPVPLIDLQRRLSIVGAIRAGGEKPARGVGKKLENWRITSPRKDLCEQAGELYGGKVTKWKSPVGDEWQVYTEQPELPVLLMPSFSLQQRYELWEGATKRTRLCDGIEEELSEQACICNAEGVDKCDLYTRLVVALPELDTMLGWKLITRGANAAHELPMMFDAARAVTSSPFVPARLRLEQRRGVVEGQVARYVVPTLDLGVGYAALVTAADPPLPELEAGAAAELPNAANPASPQPLSRARRAAAFGPESISPESASAPEVPDENGQGEQTRAISGPQKKKLNVLVGRLREAGQITTDGIYDAVASRLRDTAGLDLAMTLDAIDSDGVVHWSPLRENLTRVEANTLIDWLEKVEARESVATGREAARVIAEQGEQPTESSEAAEEEPQHITVPFNEFPPGY